MRLSKHRQPRVLPKYLPIGTVYVVEGRGGENGHLRVSSRYLVVPGGGRIDLLSRSVPAQPARVHSRGALRASAAKPPRTAGTGIKKSAATAKKFVVVAGTAA